MLQLNQVLTISKQLIQQGMEKKILTFKKIAKIPLPSPHLAAMNIEFTADWRGGGLYIGTGQRHRLMLMTRCQI